uniref:DUF418 domain-containing protein n=1 Tax=Caenorhabditis tropicalis TaxID=1561998 RepID=A0A1I7UYG3_9PELO
MKKFEEKEQLIVVSTTFMILSARYYATGEFNPGEKGTRIAFSWAKIIGMYGFWFGSFYAQYNVYSYLISSIAKFLLYPFSS